MDAPHGQAFLPAADQGMAMSDKSDREATAPQGYARELTARFGAEIDLGGEVGEIPFVRRLLARRTHRAYAQRPVEEPLLHLLTAAALSASSKSDFQQASIIRVTDADSRAALAALFPAMPWIGAAAAFLVFCGDARRLERIGTLRG